MVHGSWSPLDLHADVVDGVDGVAKVYQIESIAARIYLGSLSL